MPHGDFIMLDHLFAKKQMAASPQFRYNTDSMIQLIAEINNQLAAQFDINKIVETAVHLTCKFLGYDYVAIYLVDSSKQELCLKVETSAPQEIVTHGHAQETLSQLAYRALQQRKVIVTNEATQDVPDNVASPFQSELHIPLEYNSELLGIFNICSIEKQIFDDADSITALKILAAQIAVAMNAAYQYGKKYQPKPGNESDEKIYSHVVQIQHLLPEIQSIGGGIRNVFDKIVRGVVEGLGYTAAMLAVVDETEMTLPVQAIAYSNFTHHTNWDIVEKVLGVQIIGKYVSLTQDQNNLGVKTYYSGSAKVTQNLYDLFRPAVSESLSARIQQSTGIKSCVSIPLKAEDKVVGLLYAGSDKDQISTTDLDALHFLVTNAAIAIHNGLHFDKVSQDLALREAQLTQLRRIERVITASLNLEDVLKHILNGAVELTRATHGQVLLVGKFTSGLVGRVSYPEAVDAAIVEPSGLRELINTRPLPALDVVTELITKNNNCTFKTLNDTHEEQAYATLVVPISLNDELVGLISIARQKSDTFKAETFNELSLDLLDQLAVQAAIAIRNASQFKIEQEIRDRLSNISQVVAMGDMAGNMVHSINNWVGAIRADLKYLMRQYPFSDMDPVESMDVFKDMLTNAESTLAMAENIKKPFQSLKQEPINVNECIKQVLRDKRDELTDIIIIENLKPIVPVMATRQIELVFENLINNASYAMKGQARGILRCATRLSKDGQWVEIIIQDTGPGLPQKIKPADIFKLGVSGKENGMGYGLWWSDTFLKRWGGRIFYVDNTKRGCKFLIRLPALSEHVPQLSLESGAQ